MADELNSSDIEFDPPAVDKRAAYRGKASIELIIRDKEIDRLSSKRTVKQLQFGHGAPTTRQGQSLWVERFNSYRHHTLKQSIDTPFTGDDLLRFFDSIISKLKPNATGKPVPNEKLITGAFRFLLSYGEFTWDGFKSTRRDGQRLHTFIDDAVKDGRLIKGRWHKKTWIGFVTLSRMLRPFLKHFRDRGCWSWDVVIAKCLSVVLVAALGCRSGDVARSLGYTGNECLQWRHIELYCDGEAKFLNLRAVVTLEFQKGFKDTRNHEAIKYLRPLEDPDCVHVCPIALLLTHALRNGLVLGSTLNEVMDRAAMTPGRRIQWTHPEQPVLTAIARKPSRCDLEKPTQPLQLLETIKQMGLVSNILTRVYMHATRLGYARDLAHLPKSDEAFGITTDEIRQALGHAPTTGGTSVTEDYVGGHSREDYNARAANNSKSHRREPKFGESSAYDMVKAPITAHEVRVWKECNEGLDRGPNLSSKNEKKRIDNSIRRERLDKYRLAAPETLPIRSNSKDGNPVLDSLPHSEINARSNSVYIRHEVERPNKVQPTASVRNVPADIGSHGVHMQSDQSDYSNIDPALLDDDCLEALQVHPGDLNLLQTDIFFGQSATGYATGQATDVVSSRETACNEDDILEESGKLMLGAVGQQPIIKAEEWIEQHAKINVIKNSIFAIQWPAYADKGQPFESTIGLCSLKGNSRNDPTPWVFQCRKIANCTYRTLHKRLLDQHESACNEVLVEASKLNQTNTDRVACTWKECDQTYADQVSLQKHIKAAHTWQPKPCQHGCDVSHLYHSGSAYNTHQIAKHSGRWPSGCLYPDCTRTQQFNQAQPLQLHLKTAHGITDVTEQLQYLPPRPAKLQWIKQTCLIEQCHNSTVMRSRSRMLLHLTSGHQMSKADANDLIEQKSPYAAATRASRVLGVSKKRQPNRAFGLEDDGKIAEEVVPKRQKRG